jgi:hypothetical protein
VIEKFGGLAPAGFARAVSGRVVRRLSVSTLRFATPTDAGAIVLEAETLLREFSLLL